MKRNGMLASTLLLTTAVGSAADDGGEARHYTYAWPFSEADEMRPRGGTTRGADVVLDTEPSDAWNKLREPDISSLERDRRAILAMAGPYRTGLNRYERIVGHDFSPGDAYWQRTAPFWADVRRAWDEMFERRDRFTVKGRSDGKRLFEYAGTIDAGDYHSQSGRAFIDETLAQFVE